MSDTPRTDAVLVKLLEAGHELHRGTCPEILVTEMRLIEEQNTALRARVKRLEEAIGLVAKMHADWIEMQDEGYSGAYYAFVKGNSDEWETILKAKEDKP